MYKIGIDIGGMSIKAGIVDKDCNIISTQSIDTQVEKGFDIIAQNMVNLVKKLISDYKLSVSDVDSIGIGIPGVADKNGKVHYATNLFWTDVQLGEVFRQNFPNIKIEVENDATVACVAEHTHGSIKGVENAIMLTLGTGVGGGIIINGKKYSGTLGIGSELGHMIIGENFYDCSCGNNGCFETFCSATAIIKYTQKLLEDKKIESCLYDYDKDDITAKLIFENYLKHDKVCEMSVNRFIKHFSTGIANIINIFAPQVIVIGGGVGQAYDIFIDELYSQVRQKIIFKNLPFAKIVKASLGNDAGIIGAAML